MYAVVRIRGTVNVIPKAVKALEMLNLRRANNASIWPENDASKRMFKIVEHMVTYGKIDDATLTALIEKKGKSLEDKLDVKKVMADLKAGKTAKQAGLNNCFTLSPPKGGFERKGIKTPYVMGGVYGERKDGVSKLIAKML